MTGYQSAGASESESLTAFNFVLYPGYYPWSTDYYYYNRNRPLGPIAWAFFGLAWFVWVCGAVGAAILGPMVGAWVYRRLGIPNHSGQLHFDLLTPGRE